MPDYTTMHRNRMADATRVTKSKLERGMVAKIRYKKIDGKSRDYYVFVLQPEYKKYFHCLDLKHIAPPQMVKLAEDLNEVVSQTPKVKKLDLTKLNLDVNSKKFYLNEIRNKKLKNGYRTLIEKNISTVTVYNYDYGVFDKIPTKAEQRQEEQVTKDDDTPDFLKGI